MTIAHVDMNEAAYALVEAATYEEREKLFLVINEGVRITLHCMVASTVIPHHSVQRTWVEVVPALPEDEIFVFGTEGRTATFCGCNVWCCSEGEAAVIFASPEGVLDLYL